MEAHREAYMDWGWSYKLPLSTSMLIWRGVYQVIDRKYARGIEARRLWIMMRLWDVIHGGAWDLVSSCKCGLGGL